MVDFPVVMLNTPLFFLLCIQAHANTEERFEIGLLAAEIGIVIA